MLRRRLEYLKSLQILEELAARFPEVLLHQTNLVSSLDESGQHRGPPGSRSRVRAALSAGPRRHGEVGGRPSRRPRLPWQSRPSCTTCTSSEEANRTRRLEVLEPAIRHELAASKLQPTHYRAVNLFAWHSADLASLSSSAVTMPRRAGSPGMGTPAWWAREFASGSIVGVVRIVEVLIRCQRRRSGIGLAPPDRHSVAAYLDQARTMIRQADPRRTTRSLRRGRRSVDHGPQATPRP